MCCMNKDQFRYERAERYCPNTTTSFIFISSFRTGKRIIIQTSTSWVWRSLWGREGDWRLLRIPGLDGHKSAGANVSSLSSSLLSPLFLSSHTKIYDNMTQIYVTLEPCHITHAAMRWSARGGEVRAHGCGRIGSRYAREWCRHRASARTAHGVEVMHGVCLEKVRPSRIDY